MTTQTRTCQNCKNEFRIEPEDFAFYKRIEVPPPTWCPDCRLLRRMFWRTDIGFYRRTDSRTNKTIFSSYSDTKPIKVWELEYWISDEWDPLEYGREYNWNRSFFEQYAELIREIPWPALSVERAQNSPYCNNATNIKDSYLIFGSTNTENSFYSFGLVQSKDMFDSNYIYASELGYQNMFNRKCFKSLYSFQCNDCSDIYFCTDCINVTNSFGCVGLRNKSFCVFNEQLTKKEYEKFMKESNLGSHASVKRWAAKAAELVMKHPKKFLSGAGNVDVSGEYLNNCKSVHYSFAIDNAENMKYCDLLQVGTARDCYDYFRFSNNSELIYEAMGCGSNIARLKFCIYCYPGLLDSEYCTYCSSSNNLFGCFGLRKKQYCIFNKQYSKEEYLELVPKIIAHMKEMPYTDKRGRKFGYGEFFPPELSPFGYNETVALEYFPLSKEEATRRGHPWEDVSEKNFKATISAEDLPDEIGSVSDSVLDEAIRCEDREECSHACSGLFRIIRSELDFYRRFNIPLPRKCFPCRHYERMSKRNPRMLVRRFCGCAGQKSANGVYTNAVAHLHGGGRCPNEFQTSYSPDRPEIVYCEQCYQAETA